MSLAPLPRSQRALPIGDARFVDRSFCHHSPQLALDHLMPQSVDGSAELHGSARLINADARTPLVKVAIPILMPWSDLKGAYDNFFQKHKGSRRHALKTELIMSFSFNFASIIVLLSTQGPYKRDRDYAPRHGCVAAAVLAVSIQPCRVCSRAVPCISRRVDSIGLHLPD